MSLRDEVAAAKALTESLADMNDPDLTADTVEGETNLFEIFDRLLEANIFDAGNIDALDNAINKLSARKSAAKMRIENRKNLIAQAMDIAGIKQAKRALGTLTYKVGSLKTTITDETQIPSKFWLQQPPKLDKRALSEALKNNEIIDGAVLSNGAPVLQIRV